MNSEEFFWVFYREQFFRYLPREVDPLVYNMSHEDPGNVSFGEVGGLSEQIRELREVWDRFEGYRSKCVL